MQVITMPAWKMPENLLWQPKSVFSKENLICGGAIRHAWLTVENIDRVPDMDAIEKSRLKAEAKMIVAIYYAHMLRHYGGLPLIHKALVASRRIS